MNPLDQTLTYVVPTLPDPACSAHQAVAGGDIRPIVTKGSEHLLRTLAHMPAGSCSMELVHAFDPARGTSHGKQARLRLYLRISAATPGIARCLDRVVCGGFLSRFYQFEKTNDQLPWPDVSAAIYRIIRREEFIQPLHTSDFNYRIPERYYTVSPFVPNEQNDGMALDGVLDGIDEVVTINIQVSSVDVSAQLHAHTAYLAQLQSINRGPDFDDDDCVNVGLTGSDNHRYVSQQSQVRLLSNRDPLANDVFQAQHLVHKSLIWPHLLFSIGVAAQTEPVARLVCSVLAEAGFQKGSYRIVPGDKDRLPNETPAMANDPEIPDTPGCQGTDDRSKYKALRALANVASVDELTGIFQFPVASPSSSPRCCRKNTDPPDVDERDLIVLGYDAESGTGGGTPISRGIRVNSLAKHLSCFGKPGSGKTTNNINILTQLHAREIPFLVMECAKKEYRVLKTLQGHHRPDIRKLAQALELYTVGAERLSPLRFNPLEVLKGISVAEHIEHLINCLKASIPISEGSLPMLTLEGLEDLYEDYDRRELPPVVADLIGMIEEVLARKEYSGETRSDMQTAIQTRLGMLALGIIGKVFQCRRGMTIEHLLAVPCILELDVLPADQMRLLVLFILVWIRLYLKTAPASSGKLRYVILIEEAHVIFGTRSQGRASEEMADTNAAVSDVISRLLVELRALGIGVVLSDQHPSALDPAATKSVASMLAFLQTCGEDREELAQDMLLDRGDVQDVARLGPGEAFLITESFYGPRRIRTANLNEQMRLSPSPSDEELFQCIHDQPWFKEAARQRISDELEQLKEATDKLEDEQQAVTAKVQSLLKEYHQLLAQPETPGGARRLTEIARILCATRKEAVASYSDFLRSTYRRFRDSLDQLDAIEPPELRAFGQNLRGRCQSLIQSATPAMLKVIDEQIRKLRVTN